MRCFTRRWLGLNALLLALLAVSACAQPPQGGPTPQIHDDSRGENDHSDRGMKDDHMM